ncbi:MAG: hypothetical protein LQ338_005159 [Usnochroma carphineum]|nr:MAG: hypothetical protein LQ338_005159 [Usnochroma carphineum]
MRLLNTTSLEFEEFFNSNIPNYAILSHRWGPKEVSFKEMRKHAAPPGPGLAKIKNFCQMAKNNGLKWAWIDTCCIDKRSSAELTETINSMYKWYACSAVCYAYLSDVKLLPEVLAILNPSLSASWLDKRPEIKRSFHDSRWFTRGWTLQELLAPEHVIFFDVNWTEFGYRSELADEISSITKIPKPYLQSDSQNEPISKASIARKMSLASHRVTSREEDMAYCLLGLFDVNMSLIYGEGAVRSFHRLQIEIMRNSNDESLFAWTSDQPASGMLADRPSYFVDSGRIELESMHAEFGALRPPFTMTNRGLELSIPSNLPKTVTSSERRRCTDKMQSLARQLENTCVIYVKQPDEARIVYHQLLNHIEEDKLIINILRKKMTRVIQLSLDEKPVSRPGYVSARKDDGLTGLIDRFLIDNALSVIAQAMYTYMKRNGQQRLALQYMAALKEILSKRSLKANPLAQVYIGWRHQGWNAFSHVLYQPQSIQQARDQGTEDEDDRTV